ncbi:DUF3108 domain-containing protein [Rhodospirillales bacterium]|nr:DUF3108 domain-containing protein [Rhodospirillales bacterium]
MERSMYFSRITSCFALAILLITVDPKRCLSDIIDGLEINYQTQWGNAQIGNFKIKAERNNNKIKFDIESRSEGAISIFYDYKSNVVGTSVKHNQNWHSNSYTVNSIYNNKRYYSSIRWDQNRKKFFKTIEPPIDLKKVYDIFPSTLENAIDPITGLMRVLDQINHHQSCNLMLNIFDGRRRYNLATKSLGKEFLINDRPNSFTGQTLLCGVKISPIGGHRLESKWKPKTDKFSDIKIFFGVINGSTYLPVRMVLDRWFGTIIVRMLKS